MALGWSGVIQQEPTKFPLYAHAPTQHMLPAPARAELRAVGGAGEPDERQHLRLNQGSRCRQDRITSPVSRPSLANSQTPLFRPPCSSTLTLSLDRPATEGRARVRERERKREREFARSDRPSPVRLLTRYLHSPRRAVPSSPPPLALQGALFRGCGSITTSAAPFVARWQRTDDRSPETERQPPHQHARTPREQAYRSAR